MEQFLIYWNNLFPYDRLYRKKYKIAFNSSAHRALNPLDVYLDIKEDKLFSEVEKSYIERHNDLEDYKNTGEFLKKREDISEKQIDDIFDNLDLDMFNDKKDE